MMIDIQLSDNFWMSEFLRSRDAVLHGIPMIPSEEVIESYRWGVVNVLQPVRDVVGSMVPSSGWRPPPLNRILQGHWNSYHQALEPGRGAGDLTAPNVALVRLMEVFIELQVPFRKLILEFNQWVHISWDAEMDPPMRRVLTAVMENGNRVYKAGIVV